MSSAQRASLARSISPPAAQLVSPMLFAFAPSRWLSMPRFACLPTMPAASCSLSSQLRPASLHWTPLLHSLYCVSSLASSSCFLLAVVVPAVRHVGSWPSLLRCAPSVAGTGVRALAAVLSRALRGVRAVRSILCCSTQRTTARQATCGRRVTAAGRSAGRAALRERMAGYCRPR